MSDMTTLDRRTLFTAIGGTAVLSALGSRDAHADESKPDKYGFTTDDAELPAKINGKEQLAEPAIDLNLIEVLPYELLGGPVAIHGKVFVHIKDNPSTTTQGTVSPGPPPVGWPINGTYSLTRTDPDAFFSDDSLRPKRAVQIRLDIEGDGGYVVFRLGQKRIIVPGWRWGPWHVLKAW